MKAQAWSWPEYTTFGDTIWHTFPPVDSQYVHNEIVIKFRKGGIDLSSICYNCDEILDIYKTHGKGEVPMDFEFTDTAYFPRCKDYLMVQHFALSIILDTVTRNILASHGVQYLRRMTAANPCVDTLSISRLGDTIPMNHFMWMVAEFNNDSSVVSTLTQLYLNYSLGGIEVAQPDYIGTFAGVPGDPWYSGAPPNGPQNSLTLIGMPTAWGLEVSSPAIQVAVIDNGLDYWRCDLGGSIGAPGDKVRGGWDYTTMTQQKVYFDPGVTGGAPGHGTPVAAVIGAFTNNNGCEAMAGIAGGWGTLGGAANRGTGCSLYGYKIPLAAAGPNKFQSSDAASAILEAVANSVYGRYGNACDIINNSWAAPQSSPDIRNGISEAFANAASFVVAKNNNNTNAINFPSDVDPPRDAIAVGASDNGKLPGEGGNIRRMDYSNWNQYTDLLAPAGSANDPVDHLVYTLQYDPGDILTPGVNPDQGIWFDGTSIAAPHVSGVLALLRNYLTSTLTSPQAFAQEDPEGILKAGAQDILAASNPDPDGTNPYQPGYDDHSGWGLLKADKIFTMLDPNGTDVYKLFHLEADPSTLQFPAFQNVPFKGNMMEVFNPNGNTINPPSNIYPAKYRIVTGTVSYAGQGIDQTKEVYVWGNSSGSKRGWANMSPNWQEAWCDATSGQGGNGVVPGIQHKFSSTVTVQTYQFQLFIGGVWVNTPPDAEIGAGVTVFGATKLPSGVSTIQESTNFTVRYSRTTGDLKATFVNGISGTFQVIDVLGRIISDVKILLSTNEVNLSEANIPTGVYLCRFIEKNGTVTQQKIVITH